MEKHLSLLWILGGLLLMLPSLLGNDRPELIPIGIVFIVAGIAAKDKLTKFIISSDPESDDE